MTHHRYDKVTGRQSTGARRFEHAAQRFMTEDEKTLARRCLTVVAADNLYIRPADSDNQRLDQYVALTWTWIGQID